MKPDIVVEFVGAEPPDWQDRAMRAAGCVEQTEVRRERAEAVKRVAEER